MGSGDCAVCGDPTDPGFECSYCGVTHCAAHRIPESHGCPGDLQTPTTAAGTDMSDSEAHAQRQARSNRGDPAERMERVTTASPASVRGDDTTTQEVPNPREPTFEASSPDLNPDGSLAADDTTDSSQQNQPYSSDQLSAAHRLYYKLRGTVRAPLGLVREHMIPLLAIVVLLALVGGLLIVA